MQPSVTADRIQILTGASFGTAETKARALRRIARELRAAGCDRAAELTDEAAAIEEGHEALPEVP